MAGNAFLTDRRREFLEGDYDLDTSKDRQLKHRIKSDAKAAIEELAEVARSGHIDSTEIFEPDELAELFAAIFVPDPQHVEGGGLVYDQRGEQPDHPTTADVSDEYQQYCDRLYVAMDRPLKEYRNTRFPDPNE
jgi:hypothetical protein